MLDGNP
ncbi:hypothetical protein D046_6677A, partial [Vibrio parahaemolyticus V-223/04]